MTADPAAVRPASPLRRLPRLAVIALVGLFIALLAYGLSVKAPNDSIDQRLADGRSAAAPAFSLELLERGVVPKPIRPAFERAAADGNVGLKELRGTPVVINFWASWCSPCRDESSVLERGWRRWGGRGVLFLGLDMQDVRGDARSFLREEGTTYPAIRDESKNVATDFGATGIPETYFVSGSGQVVAHVVGVVSDRQLDIGTTAAREGHVTGKERGGAIRKAR
jgi:cytochrome c biogenesis protein CcmG/thiol:disulfide interchange protein DsbE